MKNRIPLFFLISGLLMFVSCKKEYNFHMNTGKTVTLTRPVNANFTTINLNDDVNLVITQGNTYDIKLEGGKNVLSGIETSVTDSALTIRNNNKLNWLRSYDREITAYVTLPHLLYLSYESTGTVSNTDTIREDSLTVTCHGGSGYVNMVIRAGTSKLSIINGSVDMNISGFSGVNFIYNSGYGPFNCLGLKTGFLFMKNASTNDCYVNVIQHLEYEITSMGNIYFKGDPPEVSGTITGNGKLIKYP
jgi:hypothetical protein